jgi:prepilin-type N-terminal cleavage/methylation domain-containing protein
MISQRKLVRYGMTLVELLIVIALISILTALTLPSFKAIVTDRKANQAAIVVKSVFEAARAQAIGRQREVAVVIERANLLDNGDFADEAALSDVNSLDYDPVLSNSAYRVSIAEVLPPYRGDVENSFVTLSQSNPAVPTSAVNRATIDFSQNPSARYFLNIGDLIAFDDRTERFEIISVSPANITTSTTSATVTFWNDPKVVWDGSNSRFVQVGTMPDRPRVALSRRENFTDANGNDYYDAGESYVDENGNGVYDANGHTFRIYARPRRLFAKPVTLPKGTCIDLSLSGIGNSLDTSLNRISYDFMAIPHAQASVDGRWKTFVPPAVYFVFSPRGSIASVFFDAPPDSSNYFATDYTINRELPFDDIYLFVGRSEQVSDLFTGRWDDDTNTNPNFLLTRDMLTRDEHRPNLYDSSCYWLKVNSENGQISLAPNHGVHDDSVAINLKQQIAEARQLSNALVDQTAR